MRSILLVVAACLMTVGAARAQNNAPGPAAEGEKPITIEIGEEPALVMGTMKVTLSNAIDWAVKHNFDMLSVSYEMAMLDTMYQQFQKKFAPVLSAEGGAAYMVNTPSQRMFMGKDVTKYEGSASLYKNFSTGTTVVAGVSHEYDKLSRGREIDLVMPGMSYLMGPNAYHKPGIFISVQQELLRNAFGISDRDTEKILKNAESMKKEAISFQLSLIIVQVIGEYWTVVMNKVAVEILELQVRETRKVRDITARNARYGLAEEYTLNMYNALLAGAEAQLEMARQRYHESLRSFLTTINVDEKTNVTETAVFTDRYRPVSVEEALKAAYEKRADYRNALLSLENAKMSLRIARNNALPSLKAELNGLSTTENRKVSGAYADVFSLKYPAMEGKLKFSYPIGDKDLYIQQRNARFRVKQAELQLEKYKRSVKDDVVNKVENIETTYRIYQKAKEGRRQAELFYRGMLADMGRGRLNASLTKNGLDAFISGRQQELMALVYYNIALLQLDVAKNDLFEKYGVEIEKYIPQDIKK